eukprot:Clim_evm4s67 gene=Clim_evmTU4s67
MQRALPMSSRLLLSARTQTGQALRSNLCPNGRMVLAQTMFAPAVVGVGQLRNSRLRGKYVVPPRDGETVESFLTKIGRNTVQFADRFDNWEHLFRATSYDLKEMGMDVRTRKFLLGWVERYRLGLEPYEWKPRKGSRAEKKLSSEDM